MIYIWRCIHVNIDNDAKRFVLNNYLFSLYSILNVKQTTVSKYTIRTMICLEVNVFILKWG